MADRRRVILHMGFHKTGSSALQVFFSSAADDLAVAGIDYPSPEPSHNIAAGLAVGNLPILIRQMSGDDVFDLDQATEFQNRFSAGVARGICQLVDETPFETVLISGELFPLVPADRLSGFLAQLAQRHDPEILCLVRDPFDFLLSMWKQQVRVQIYTRGFEAYIDDVLSGRQQASMLTCFDALAQCGIPMTVLRYERVRGDIVGGTLQALGLAEPDLMALARPRMRINASEPASRTALAIELLQETDDPDLTDVVMRTLAARSSAPAGPEPYDPNLHARILDHFGRTIGRINSFLPPEDALATDIRAQEFRPPAVHEPDRHLARAILAELAQTSSGRPEDTRDPALPVGFDPAVYLLRNPDLVAAGVDPVEHFLGSGRRENRPWRTRRDRSGQPADAGQRAICSGDA
ncbi:MAG: hypothetical protein RIR62_862 [Pseudomonadota bacterium]